MNLRPFFATILAFASMLVACEGSIAVGTSRPPSVPSSNSAGPSDPYALPGAGGSPGTSNPGDPTDPADPGNPPPGEPPPELPAFAPAPFFARRLVSRQYKNAIEDLLGSAAAATLVLPDDVALNGLDAIGASQIAITSSGDVTLFEQNAFKAAQAALASTTGKAALVTCVPTGPLDTACMTTVVKAFGKRVFRRALTDAEAAKWVALGKDASGSYSDFMRGVEFVVAGMLQAPSFLYLIEVGVPEAAVAQGRRLLGYEMASRLSFFLTGSTPSNALLAAAESGGLDSAAGVRTQALELLKSPRAKSALWSHFDELLGTRELPHTSKDASKFPGFNAGLAASMREETRRTIEHIAFTQNADARTLFDTSTTFVDPGLAAHYGLPAPMGAGFAQVTLPPTGLRAGILTQAAFLAVQASSVSTSVVHRGKFVRESLLCETIAAPPTAGSIADQITMQAAASGAQRDLSNARMGNSACKGCHAMMDPLGLAFESFDAVGRARSDDASGYLDDKAAGAFTNTREFMALLRADARVPWCMTRTLFRQAAGHLELPGEVRPLTAVREAFAASGYKLQTLLVEVAASDAFRMGVLPEGALP